MIGGLWDRLPALPGLSREVEIPVYVIHTAPDPEAYFFIFDFELFMDRSKAGTFVRPKLRVWAGRHDFDRRLFARQFRESFAAEFDRMRRSVARREGGGWLTWGADAAILGEVAAAAVLLVAMGAGRVLARAVPIPSWIKGRSKEAQVEDEVDAIKARVDDVLARIEIVLHRDLYAHAYRGQGPGPFPGMDHEAWPLPDFVTEHLGETTSRGWW